MIFFVVTNLVVFGLLGLSIFHAALAAYILVSYVLLFEIWLFFADSAKPRPDPKKWTPDEVRIIRRYHLAIRFNASRYLARSVSAIRMESFIWIPWMAWNHLWAPSSFLLVNWFITSGLSVRLDPYFWFSDAIRRGKYEYAEELSLLQAVQTRMNNRWGASDEVRSFLDALQEAARKLDGPSFRIIRQQIEEAVQASPDIIIDKLKGGVSPRLAVYSLISNRAGDMAESGDYHIWSGVLNPLPIAPGQDLLRIFDAAADEMVSLGAATPEYAERQKQALRSNIKNAG